MRVLSPSPQHGLTHSVPRRPLNIITPLPTHEGHPRHRAEARHRIKTIRLRGPAREPGRGSIVGRHAPKSQKLQRRQRARGEDHGRQPCREQGRPRDGVREGTRR